MKLGKAFFGVAAGLVGAVLSTMASATQVPAPPGGRWLRYPIAGAEVKAIVFDPSPGGAAFLGTAQGGIYVSADRGRSWSAPPGGVPFPGFAVSALALDPSGPVLWAALTGVIKGGLLARSDNAGRSFTVVRSWETEAGARAVSVGRGHGSGGVAVVAVAGDIGVEVSIDRGKSWSFSRPPLDPGSGIGFLTFAPDGALWVGSFRHPFRSRDLGRTWERRATGMVEDTTVFQIDFSSTRPADVWAATCGWAYRSTDGGANWTRHREGLADRRTHAIQRDPSDDTRILAGTTGGIFESDDAGRTFRRVGPDVVVNVLAFDPSDSRILLVGTEAEGVLRSEDAGVSFRAANVGLSETRLASVAVTSKGRVVVARAADGRSGGLVEIYPASGRAVPLPGPPASVVSLATVGERLVAATPEGIFISEAPGRPFALVRPGRATVLLKLPVGAGPAPLLAASGDGVASSRDGRTWEPAGLQGRRVEALFLARAGGSPPVAAARTGNVIHFWDGRGWSTAGPAGPGPRRLAGGFGRPRSADAQVPRFDLMGLAARTDGGVQELVYRPPAEPDREVVLASPESGLPVAGWAGDPRDPGGLWIATMGRGLFRFVPGGRVSGSSAQRPR